MIIQRAKSTAGTWLILLSANAWVSPAFAQADAPAPPPAGQAPAGEPPNAGEPDAEPEGQAPDAPAAADDGESAPSTPAPEATPGVSTPPNANTPPSAPGTTEATSTAASAEPESEKSNDAKLRRRKSLKVTTGAPPTKLDVGTEADLLGVKDDDEISERLDKWTFTLKGYLRAPMIVGIGDRDDGYEGKELHSPPRLVGNSSGRWNYASLAQNPALSLYANFGNPLVSANIIMSANTLADGAYDSLDRIGGIRQAYLTLKFPEVFGESGGLALTVGGFSNRYGSAGRNQVNSGYYGTYLFGRTHTAGEVLTANIDITEKVELILEHGFGAKVDVIPFITPDDPYLTYTGSEVEADFFEGQGLAPQGSNFLHHGHAAIWYDDWLQVAAHYLRSWAPPDNYIIAQGYEATRQEEARMSVWGGEVHVDGESIGNGYLGFARLTGRNLYPLGNALQVIHGSNGRGIKENYFGDKDRILNYRTTNDGGTVDTLSFQYLLHLAPYFESLPFGARDISVAVYSMLNHAVSPKRDGLLDEDIDVWKLKFGTEFQMALMKYVSIGGRFDRVQPNLDDDSDAYTAISPRLYFRTTWQTKEYIIMNYTHYFLGDRAFPGSPYSEEFKADADMFSLTAIMSF